VELLRYLEFTRVLVHVHLVSIRVTYMTSLPLDVHRSAYTSSSAFRSKTSNPILPRPQTGFAATAMPG
jgi:hypothetical protein